MLPSRKTFVALLGGVGVVDSELISVPGFQDVVMKWVRVAVLFCSGSSISSFLGDNEMMSHRVHALKAW